MIWECEEEYNNLKSLDKDQLIQIINDYRRAYFMIGETLVEESKGHRDNKDAVENIRKYLNDMPHYSFWSENLAEEIDYRMLFKVPDKIDECEHTLTLTIDELPKHISCLY